MWSAIIFIQDSFEMVELIPELKEYAPWTLLFNKRVPLEVREAYARLKSAFERLRATPDPNPLVESWDDQNDRLVAGLGRLFNQFNETVGTAAGEAVMSAMERIERLKNEALRAARSAPPAAHPAAAAAAPTAAAAPPAPHVNTVAFIQSYEYKAFISELKSASAVLTEWNANVKPNLGDVPEFAFAGEMTLKQQFSANVEVRARESERALFVGFIS